MLDGNFFFSGRLEYERESNGTLNSKKALTGEKCPDILHWTVSENSDTMQVVIRKVMEMSFEDRVDILKMQCRPVDVEGKCSRVVEMIQSWILFREK